MTYFEKMEDFLDAMDKEIIIEHGEKLELYLVNEIMGKYGATNMRILDKYYYTIEKEDVQKILDLTSFSKEDFVNEEYDCDDYAFSLKGLFSNKYLSRYAVGWCVSDSHAFNFFIDKSFTVWVIEPQSKHIVKYQDILDEVEDDQLLDLYHYKIKSYLI